MKSLRWTPAVLSAVVMVVLSSMMPGIRLEPEGTSLTIKAADPETLYVIGVGILVVFFFQLLRAPIDQKTAQVKKLLPPVNTQGLKTIAGNRSVKTTLICFAAAGLMIWPFFVSRGAVDLATLALIYVMLGLGLNIVVGLAGLLDLGYVGFYAVGAYSYALLNQYFGLDFWSGLVMGGLLAAFFGFILGFPVLRLRGDYLAIVTLGFGEIIRILLNNWTHITGGPNGISQIPKPTLFGLEFGRRAKEEGNVPFHEFLPRQ